MSHSFFSSTFTEHPFSTTFPADYTSLSSTYRPTTFTRSTKYNFPHTAHPILCHYPSISFAPFPHLQSFLSSHRPRTLTLSSYIPLHLFHSPINFPSPPIHSYYYRLSLSTTDSAPRLLLVFSASRLLLVSSARLLPTSCPTSTGSTTGSCCSGSAWRASAGFPGQRAPAAGSRASRRAAPAASAPACGCGCTPSGTF